MGVYRWLLATINSESCLLIKKMNKSQLCEKVKIITNAMAKLGRNEDVRVEVLARICLELDCSMDEIMEILPLKREDMI